MNFHKSGNTRRYTHLNVKASEKDLVIALAGNPNTGKSTIFNNLTGLKQHTGNWPGKTVSNASGHYIHRGKSFLLVDLPGTYSLLANSPDETIARDFICFEKPDATIIVVDATNLERNLNLTLQVLEATDTAVLCINLLDEAEKMGITINIDKLTKELGIPVVGTIARTGTGLTELKDIVYEMSLGRIKTNPYKIVYSMEIEHQISEIIPKLSEFINNKLVLRWVALRLIEGDKTVMNSIEHYLMNNHIESQGTVYYVSK